MVTERYKKYLASIAWQAKRQAVFAKYGKRCFACGTPKPPMHVHHLDYRHLGNEPLSDLIPLCRECHKQVTRIYKRNRKRGLRRVTMEFVTKKRANRKAQNG